VGSAGTFFFLPGRNYWISAYGLGDGSLNARAFFAFNDRCERDCDIDFGPGCVRGPAFGFRQLPGGWHKNSELTSIGGPKDYAFLVAGKTRPSAVLDPRGTTPACPADFNVSGSVTVQDLFDYIAAWSTGCP
jgi:hypothetical protein